MAVLLIPSRLFFNYRTSCRDVDQPLHGYRLKIITFVWHWIDIAKGYIGTAFLLNSLQYNVSNPSGEGKLIAAVHAGILFVSVVTHSVACKKSDSMLAPFGLLIGIMLSCTSLCVSFMALILSLTTLVAIGSGSAALVAFGLALIFLGYFLFPNFVRLGTGMVLIITPLVLSWLFRRTLTVAYRGRARSEQ